MADADERVAEIEYELSPEKLREDIDNLIAGQISAPDHAKLLKFLTEFPHTVDSVMNHSARLNRIEDALKKAGLLL